MSSINTTFQPVTATYAVDNSVAAQVKEAVQNGANTFRVRNIAATAAVTYLAWGRKAAGLAAAAPTIGSPVSNTIGIPGNGVVYIEVPPDSFFIASSIAPSLEITGGQGGVGG